MGFAHAVVSLKLSSLIFFFFLFPVEGWSVRDGWEGVAMLFFLYIFLTFLLSFDFPELGDIHLFFMLAFWELQSHTVAKTLTCMYCTTGNTESKRQKKTSATIS